MVANNGSKNWYQTMILNNGFQKHSQTMVTQNCLKQYSPKGGVCAIHYAKNRSWTVGNGISCPANWQVPYRVCHTLTCFFFFKLRAKMLCRTKHTSSLYRTLVEVHTLSLYRTLCRTHTLSPYRTRCIPFGRKEQLGWDSMEKVLIGKIRKSMWGGWVGWGTHFM